MALIGLLILIYTMNSDLRQENIIDLKLFYENNKFK